MSSGAQSAYQVPGAAQPARQDGTTNSLPEEVLTTKVAQYSFRISKELYALRATSKSGLALAQRGLRRRARSCAGMLTSRRSGSATRRGRGACSRRLHSSLRPRSSRKDRGARRVRPENGGLFSLNLWTCNVTAEAY